MASTKQTAQKSRGGRALRKRVAMENSSYLIHSFYWSFQPTRYNSILLCPSQRDPNSQAFPTPLQPLSCDIRSSYSPRRVSIIECHPKLGQCTELVAKSRRIQSTVAHRRMYGTQSSRERTPEPKWWFTYRVKLIKKARVCSFWSLPECNPL